MRTIGHKSRVWLRIGIAIVTLMVCWVQALTVKVAVQSAVKPAVQPAAKVAVQPAGKPAVQPAEYIGEARCIECHGQENKHFSETLHAKIFRLNPKNDRERQGCEACHGPGSEHAKNATRQDQVNRFHTALGNARGRPEWSVLDLPRGWQSHALAGIGAREE